MDDNNNSFFEKRRAPIKKNGDYHKNNHVRRRSMRTARKRRRGVGAIIGGTILTLILFTSVFIYFLVILQNERAKGENEIQATKLDEQKRLETFIASTGSMLVPDSDDPAISLIQVIVNNTGPLPLNATYAIVTRDGAPPKENPLHLLSSTDNPEDQVLNPGQAAIFGIESPDPNPDPNLTYQISVISTRGNMISALWPPSEGGSGGGDGVGGGSGNGVGQNNTGLNIGTGDAAIYAGMDGERLTFKRLVQGEGITLINGTDTVTISATGDGVGEVNDGQSIGCDPTPSIVVPDCANTYAGKSGVSLQFYSLKAGTGITITKDIANGNIIIDGGQGQNATFVGRAIYMGMNGNDLVFRTIQGAGGITTRYSADGNSVIIDGSGIGGGGGGGGGSPNQNGIVQGTGSLQLDFKSFGAIFPQFKSRAGVEQTGWLVKSANATGYPAFMLPTGPQTYLVERVRNLDPEGYTINLGRSSGMTLSQGKCTGGQCQPVYVCNSNINSNGNVVQGAVTALNDPTTYVSIPAVPLDSEADVGWRDVLLCAHEQKTVNPWWVQSQMSNINSAFMVARGVYGGTNFAYAQTIPYQSIIVANAQQAKEYANSGVQPAAMFACLLITNTNTACTDPTAIATPAGAKYQDTVANVRAGSQIWIHVNSNCNCGYNVSWIYPTNGLVRNLVTGANLNSNGNVGGNAVSSIPITLPTTMADGVTQIQAGYYTIMLSTGYTGPDSNDNYNQGVFYFTFHVT